MMFESTTNSGEDTPINCGQVPAKQIRHRLRMHSICRCFHVWTLRNPYEKTMLCRTRTMCRFKMPICPLQPIDRNGQDVHQFDCKSIRRRRHTHLMFVLGGRCCEGDTRSLVSLNNILHWPYIRPVIEYGSFSYCSSCPQ